jgi:fatty-acyl-CoA synthase
MGHPAVACAAVVAVPDERWGERPVLLVELKPDTAAAPEDFRAFLNGKVARWWMPETVRIVDRLPLGATGKIDKKTIRRDLCDLGR